MSRFGLDKKKMLMSAIVLTVAVMLVFVGSTFQWKVEATDQTAQDKKVLNVAGQAKIDAVPDIAYVSMGVISEDQDAKVAQQKNAASMAAVVAKIKASGVKPEDIKTISYNISPKYNYMKDTGTSVIIGYSVSNSIRVTVRDITKTGSLIDIAADAGVNTSSSISFGLSDYEKYYNQALKKAVEIAKNRAATIAQAMNISLKSPVSINESGGYEPVYNSRTTYANDTKAGSAQTPVEAGSMTVQASVNITYTY